MSTLCVRTETSSWRMPGILLVGLVPVLRFHYCMGTRLRTLIVDIECALIEIVYNSFFFFLADFLLAKESQLFGSE